MQIVCRTASVVLLCCSYFIKPQCAIMLIAMMLVQAAYTLGKPSRRSFLRLGAAAACAAVTFVAAVRWSNRQANTLASTRRKISGSV